MVICYSLCTLSFSHPWAWEMRIYVGQPLCWVPGPLSSLINSHWQSFTFLALWAACLEEKMLRTLKASWIAQWWLCHLTSSHPLPPDCRQWGTEEGPPLLIVPLPAFSSHCHHVGLRQEAPNGGPVSMKPIRVSSTSIKVSFSEPTYLKFLWHMNSHLDLSSPVSSSLDGCSKLRALHVSHLSPLARGLFSQNDLKNVLSLCWSSPSLPKQ